MKQDLVSAIIKAHYRHEHERMKGLVLQVAAHTKNEALRSELTTLATNSLIALPEKARNFVRCVPSVAPSDLLLNASISAAIDDLVDEFSARMEIALSGLKPRQRVLFHGPPGNGKSTAAAMLCGRIGVQGYLVSLANVIGSYQGVSAANFATLLPVLNVGVCLIMDEIDAVGDRRGGGGDSAAREKNATLNTILTLLDQQESGLLIATTNRRDMLDPALLRRFDLELEFPAPTAAEACALCDKLCDKFKVPALAPVFLRAKKPGGWENFDEVTKTVIDVARKRAVAKWRAERDAAE